ncbi:hypothetical protein BDZ89DRAFT_1231080 [Hymenopellis radicata]|nr:hypothetical protein BDZ89DRAFT_1231080 [Hymenopellis radicata]
MYVEMESLSKVETWEAGIQVASARMEGVHAGGCAQSVYHDLLLLRTDGARTVEMVEKHHGRAMLLFLLPLFSTLAASSSTLPPSPIFLSPHFFLAPPTAAPPDALSLSAAQMSGQDGISSEVMKRRTKSMVQHARDGVVSDVVTNRPERRLSTYPPPQKLHRKHMALWGPGDCPMSECLEIDKISKARQTDGVQPVDNTSRRACPNWVIPASVPDREAVRCREVMVETLQYNPDLANNQKWSVINMKRGRDGSVALGSSPDIVLYTLLQEFPSMLSNTLALYGGAIPARHHPKAPKPVLPKAKSSPIVGSVILQSGYAQRIRKAFVNRERMELGQGINLNRKFNASSLESKDKKDSQQDILNTLNFMITPYTSLASLPKARLIQNAADTHPNDSGYRREERPALSLTRSQLGASVAIAWTMTMAAAQKEYGKRRMLQRESRTPSVWFRESPRVGPRLGWINTVRSKIQSKRLDIPFRRVETFRPFPLTPPLSRNCGRPQYEAMDTEREGQMRGCIKQ